MNDNSADGFTIIAADACMMCKRLFGYYQLTRIVCLTIYIHLIIILHTEEIC